MSRLIFTFHLTACMCQLLMFTYSCDCLIRDSTNVANATYNSLWSFMPMDKYGKMLRKDLILVIMRSKSPCYLTALGFFPVSLETYTSVSFVQHKIKNQFSFQNLSKVDWSLDSEHGCILLYAAEESTRGASNNRCVNKLKNRRYPFHVEERVKQVSLLKVSFYVMIKYNSY